jgi:hypothetical protein
MYSFTRVFCTALVAVLFAVPLGVFGQKGCITNVCFSCPEEQNCSGIQPSVFIGNDIPTVAEMKKSCVCSGCKDPSTECLLTDAETGEPLTDSSLLRVQNRSSTAT